MAMAAATSTMTATRSMASRQLAHTMPLLVVVVLTLLTLAPTRVAAMKQTWSFEDEDREQFLIERFGFGLAGHMDVRVRDVAFTVGGKAVDPSAVRAGLLFVHEDSLWDAMQQMQDARDGGAERYCVLQNRSADAAWIDLTDAATWTLSRAMAPASDTGEALTPGFYYLFFAHCTHELQTSFHMDAAFRNGALNYLSAGDAPLPAVYLVMSLAFLAAAVLWLRHLRANATHIHSVHHVMTVLVLFKTASLFAESMRFYYMKTHGDALTGWTAVYYVFAFLKGVTLVAVLLLIGSGWSLLKPHLSRRDKTVVSAVLLLQVASNTVMIAVEETAVGTQSWTTWRDVLHVLDLACCVGILVPIVGSIRALRQAAFTDGKAHVNLQKLTQFRAFYIVVVTYIYVTRVALFLLTASLPYDATWVAVLLGELASAAFFSATGYRFRPVERNPYLQVSTRIDALDEFALDDLDDDLDGDFAVEIQQSVPLQRRDLLKIAGSGPPTAAASSSSYRSDL